MAGAQETSGTGPYADPAPIESARKRTKKLGDGRPVVESSGWQTVRAWAVDFGVVAVLAAVASAAVAGWCGSNGPQPMKPLPGIPNCPASATKGAGVADAGRTWLVRRAERLYGDRLGRLRHSELSWHIAWKWLPALAVVGFVYGTIMQFTGRPSSQRDPALFSDIPLFLVTSILTGLVLWSLTLFWSFRRVLVFDRGLLYGYAQKQTARAIFWPHLDPVSLRTVEAPAGVSADGLLKTNDKSGKTSLGVRGRYAVVFHGLPTALAAGQGGGAGSGAPKPGFFTFSTGRIPDRLVMEIQRAMAESGLQRPGPPGPRALPPVQISSATRLDQA